MGPPRRPDGSRRLRTALFLRTTNFSGGLVGRWPPSLGPPIDETNDAGIPDSAPPRHSKQAQFWKGAWGWSALGPLTIPPPKWQKQQSPESRFYLRKLVGVTGTPEAALPRRTQNAGGGAGKVGVDQIPEPPFGGAHFSTK